MDFLHISILNVGWARTRHEWGGRDVSSPFARLYYVKEGAATLHLGARDLVVRPGYMYLVPAFMPHSYTCQPGFEFYYMFVYEMPDEASGLGEGLALPLEVRANEAIDLLFTHYCQLYPQLSLPFASAAEFNRHAAYRDYLRRFTAMEAYEKMQLQGLVWIITSYFVKHAERRHEVPDARLVAVTTYIRQHVASSHTLERLSAVGCVSPSQLHRLFQRALGISPIHYALRAKVRLAQRLLLSTELTVGEVAARVGLTNVSYFVRLFKKEIGLTPKVYRESLRY